MNLSFVGIFSTENGVRNYIQNSNPEFGDYFFGEVFCTHAWGTVFNVPTLK